jgi:hypothetical protein
MEPELVTVMIENTTTNPLKVQRGTLPPTYLAPAEKMTFRVDAREHWSSVSWRTLDHDGIHEQWDAFLRARNALRDKIIELAADPT